MEKEATKPKKKVLTEEEKAARMHRRMVYGNDLQFSFYRGRH